MRNDFQEGAFLAHSAKGTTWKNVKYIKKVPLGNGKFYYIYNQSQLNALGKKNSGAVNVLSNKERQKRLTAATKAVTVEDLARKGFAASGKTAAEKVKSLKNNISKGEKKIQEALSKSSKKSKSGSSGSSGSKKSGSGSKGSSGSSGSKKSGSGKEKSASKKTASEKKEKTTNKKQRDTTPINMDSLKKIYGIKDEEVTTHEMSSSEFKSKMLSKYDEGSFGYLMSGDKAYKWSISGGQFILKDFDTDKEVSFDTYLKDAKSFQEFQTNKKKKK